MSIVQTTDKYKVDSEGRKTLRNKWNWAYKVASALYFIHQEQNKNNSTSVRKNNGFIIKGIIVRQKYFRVILKGNICAIIMT